MKATIFRQNGGPEVLEYVDMPDPVPGSGEILIRVKACSINHLDIWIREGIPSYKIKLPHISGCDVAGVVEAVGSGVKKPKVGDRVVLAPGMGCNDCPVCKSGAENRCGSYRIRGAATDGGYAELCVARAVDAVAMNDDLSFQEAAAYPLTFLTAWHMLVSRAALQKGETVLIQAAGSGIGHAAVQIAKHLGARVITTVGSQAKLAKAQALGADHVVDYSRQNFEEAVKRLTDRRGVDVVFEHTGSQTFEKSLRSLAQGGRLVVCGATSGPSVTLDLRYLFSRQLSLLGSMMGTNDEFAEVTKLVMKKSLRPVVDTVFPLAQARAAQERMLRRDVFGKLVLTPAD